MAAACEDTITRDGTWRWYFARLVNGTGYRNSPADVETSGVLSREARRAA